MNTELNNSGNFRDCLHLWSPDPDTIWLHRVAVTSTVIGSLSSESLLMFCSSRMTEFKKGHQRSSTYHAFRMPLLRFSRN
ncbi:hypothetical protein MPTK1_7g13410 [Marchantia polymorpha subsp. ruderalis]|uniref:Uncharacterized protein n=2 Tax=Marchantia polymorpha TaxID=3197 RepID=A0AAF6BZ58_MARPO|nr:hypothetical protein MARPO_0009s0027 [Marchantia polymorpha]BBN17292.1 hypothetical protein Mp_7g13410 [Marchantia polymorpha subsp. ruderalis]|eukprot:PTQ46897.1 hypothetical protein MARPO_0009s0027 [Marchantia polymorpha]